MITQFDLTGDRFRLVDFRQGVVAFNPVTIARPTVEIMVWGMVAYQDSYAELFADLQSKLSPQVVAASPCPLYLSGWGKLVYEQARSIFLQLAPVAPNLTGDPSLMTIDNEQVTLKQLFQLDPNVDEDNPGDPVYSMDVYLEQPYGDLYMNVLAHGKVTLEIDPQDFIPFDVYRQNPKEYGFDRFRERIEIS